ncbi:hypothetical protein [Acidithiobacillus sp.]|uniref:hypothetical protein n=1 Tax=Acidithiobacillus sp. TaxID=1872118 RepID=UPI0026174511|nr:hypothetical protein [Acidithiobacillus sp.]MDD5278721.1 hypothetical protein [Acidithiobacillus sp.]
MKETQPSKETLNQYVEQALAQRQKFSLFNNQRKSRSFHDISTLVPELCEIDIFFSKLEKVEKESLKPLRHARKNRRLRPYYQYCDNIRHENYAVQYSIHERNHVAGFEETLNYLQKTTEKGIDNMKAALWSLEKIQESPARNKLIEAFMDVARQFEPETRMLPVSDVLDKSMWSSINSLLMKCEKMLLKTRQRTDQNDNVKFISDFRMEK